MRQSSRRWLAGAVLILVLGAGGISVPSGLAQTPGSDGPPAGTAPAPQPEISLVSGVGSPIQPPQPGLPAARPTGNEVQRQDGVIRLDRNVPGEAKPILLDADQITSWNEGGMTVFLLSGQVLVQQNVVQARFEQGVAWVDVNRYKATGILHVDIYAEGRVWVDASSKIQEGERAVLGLTTRGEFRVRAGKGKMQRQDRSGDPLVAKARAAGVGPRRAAVVPASGVAPTPTRPAAPTPPPPASPAARPGGGGIPAPPAPSGGVRQMSFEEPKPGRDGPASADIRLAQATTPGPSASAIPDAAPDGVPPPREPVRPESAPAPSGSRSNLPPAPTPDIPAPPAPAGPIAPPPASPLPIPPAPVPTPPPVPGALPARSTPGLPLEYRILPRGGKAFDSSSVVTPDGKRVTTVSGGLILNVRNVPKLGVIDVEADRAVIWSMDSKDSDKGAPRPAGAAGETSNEVEFYLAGHVILRSALNPKDRTVVEADELYYDARRNVAIALQSRLQLESGRTTKSGMRLVNEPAIITSPRLLQTGATTYEVREAEIFSSKLPSDPGLRLLVASATITTGERQKTNLFGQPVLDAKGQPVVVPENLITARDVVSELEGVPFFYTPYLKTDINSPMGPLETINFGENNVFGAFAGVGLNVNSLLGIQPIAGTHWRLLLDYLSRRGPAIGTNFDYAGTLPSLKSTVNGDPVIPNYIGTVRLYGIDDAGTDILGGNRPFLPFQPTGFRGRALFRQSVWDLPEGFDVIAQMSLLSDRNFLEQYFKREFDTDPNQATFAYVKQQQDNWAWSALAQVQTSPWITTTQWLPRLDGYLIGQPIFDLFTTNTRVGAAFADLRPSNDPTQQLLLPNGTLGPPVPIDQTTRRDTTGRAYLLEEVNMPLDLGAFKVVPYVKGAAIGYTNDLEGDPTLRLWGAVGARASVPLTKLYADAQSDLFNVNALNHKMVFSANYIYARANESHTLVPQLDQLNDDATNSSLREFKPQQPLYNPTAGLALATSPLFDPQSYAIRRLVMNRLDTLDSIDELQLDLRQRLQTKRGYPGAEHIVDWMTLDTSVSLFPETGQNFGKAFSFAEYRYNWNLGDRTTFESTGWYDPENQGPKVFTAGMYFNRPDRTSFYIGYRQTDPLQSRVVTGSVTYVFSPKYAMTGTVAYDLGLSGAINNSVVFTRTGSDLQVSLGFSYNSLQNNFGAIVEIVPTLIPLQRGGANFLQR